jgi:hypothetical protein
MAAAKPSTPRAAPLARDYPVLAPLPCMSCPQATLGCHRLRQGLGPSRRCPPAHRGPDGDWGPAAAGWDAVALALAKAAADRALGGARRSGR